MMLEKQGTTSKLIDWDNRDTPNITFPPVPPDEPVIVALQPKGNWVSPDGFKFDSDGNKYGFSVGTQDFNMNYKVFFRYSTQGTPSSGWGLLVWDAEGNLVYDSQILEGKIADIVTPPSVSPIDLHTDGPVTFNHAEKPDAFYTVSTFPLGLWGEPNPDSTGNTWYWKAMHQIDDYTVEMDVVAAGDEIANSDWYPGAYTSPIMIIDDSGF